MNKEVFNQLIESFNQGEIEIHIGLNWCFLYDNKWYPSFRFMSAYYELNEDINLNLYRAVFELSKFFPVVSAQLNFENNFPITAG